MAHHGRVPIVTYGQALFQWLRDQLIMVEEYAYAGTDFLGDPDLALPKGSQWGEIGKKDIFLIYVVFGILIIIFFLLYLFETKQGLSTMQMWHHTGLQDHPRSRDVERWVHWWVKGWMLKISRRSRKTLRG
jgi:hypothetical protein